MTVCCRTIGGLIKSIPQLNPIVFFRKSKLEFNELINKSRIRTELFDPARHDTICQLTEKAAIPTKEVKDALAVWGKSFQNFIEEDDLKQFENVEKRTLKLASYCCSVQACNLVLNRLPSVSADDKVTLFQEFQQDLSRHRCVLAKAMATWLAKEAGIDK